MARVGQIMWRDLTVPNATAVREFYEQVVGWQSEDVPVDDHTDYNMLDAENTVAAGICHQAGPNATMPAQWMVYIAVADLAASLESCKKLSGKVLVPPRGEPGQQFAVIQDPAGAVCALIEASGD